MARALGTSRERKSPQLMMGDQGQQMMLWKLLLSQEIKEMKSEFSVSKKVGPANELGTRLHLSLQVEIMKAVRRPGSRIHFHFNSLRVSRPFKIVKNLSISDRKCENNARDVLTIKCTNKCRVRLEDVDHRGDCIMYVI